MKAVVIVGCMSESGREVGCGCFVCRVDIHMVSVMTHFVTFFPRCIYPYVCVCVYVCRRGWMWVCTRALVCVRAHMYVHVRVFVCVCVCQGERERE